MNQPSENINDPAETQNVGLTLSFKKSLTRIKDRIDSLIYPVRVRSRLSHFRLIRGQKTLSMDDQIHECLCCGNTFQGNYCNSCGQSSRTSRYRFRNSLKTFLESLTSINNRFLRTLLELLYRPGYMISDFIRGKRVSYVSPLQALFLLAALYVIAVQLFNPGTLKSLYPDKEVILPRTTTEKSGSAVMSRELSKGEDTLEITKIGRLFFGLRDYVNRTPFLGNVYKLLKHWIGRNSVSDIVLFLPFFSLASYLTFRGRKNKVRYNPTEHFYIQTFIACQLLLLSLLISLLKGKISIDGRYETLGWLIFLVFWLDYKQIFGRSWWNTFWCTLQFFFYSLLLSFTLAACIILFLLLLSAIIWRF
ncbi:DUF3667 domain-containing protein [Porphyromonas sp.]|uniref:DUF3667 domain-containing protein n=1 Tax=Porphyromonas sp. TaxID=1924944 RepID=UPI0026DABEB1|nr:DUF3667 domain-containing protein [Porphyromonas sp.]MDO4770432.1 DUF3667 domain-containing protein [Porphyromonas sp.]